MPVSIMPAQAKVLRFVAGFIEAHGIAPSRHEIADGLGQVGTGNIQRQIEALEERGALRRTGRISRGIEVLAPVPIPRAPDGAPLFFVRIEEAA